MVYDGLRAANLEDAVSDGVVIQPRHQIVENIFDGDRLGYSDCFSRLWEYYLCYCEAAFRERVVGSAQLVFAKPAARHDLLALPLPIASAEQ